MGSEAMSSGWDLYREIHKAMRLALFGVITQAGRIDGADDAAVAALVDEWATVEFLLRTHHVHEDEFCDELVRVHAPQLCDELEAGHRQADADLDRLHQAASSLSGVDASERPSALGALHLDLADFAASYLVHLRFEEDQVMPALNVAMADDELEAVTNAIRGSVPPPDMCVFIRYMVPAMNPAERADMLGGMHAGAPPEVFEVFRAAAEGCLDAADYRQLAVAAGFG